MKFHFFLTLFLLTHSSLCFTQVKSFGEVSIDEFEAKYPEQEVEILFDQITYYYTYPGDDVKLNKERHIRILINNEAGFKFSNVFIAFYERKFSGEKIRKIEASTYLINKNGQIDKIPLDKNSIFEEKVNDNQRTKNFALAQIQEGCIIEYAYHLESDYIADIGTWTFQKQTPVHWSECNLKIPPFFDFIVQPENIDSFYIEEEMSDRLKGFYLGAEFYNSNYRWVLKDIKPWEKEPLTTDISDYFPKLNFQFLEFNPPKGDGIGFAQNWSDFSNEYLNSDIKGYKNHLIASKPLKELASSLNTKLAEKSELEKMILIRQFVADQFKYNGEQRLRPEHSQKEFLNHRKGNAADINMLLFNLLKQHDIEVKAVLLSTISHGKVNTNFPFRGDYNYFLVRCQIGSDYYLLDATNPRRPYYLLPSYCLIDRALVLEKKDAKWIGISHKPISKYIRTCTYIIDNEIITGKASWTYDNHWAVSKREELLNQEEYQFIEDLQKEEFFDFVLDTMEINNKKQYDKPIKINADFNRDTELTELLYLPPFPKLEETISNAFVAKDRKYPIHWDFLREYIFSTRIIIKGNYEIIDFPKSTTISFPDGSVKFSLNSVHKNNILSIRYKLNINGLDYYKDAYKAFKELFDMISEKQSEYIVIKRKE